MVMIIIYIYNNYFFILLFSFLQTKPKSQILSNHSIFNNFTNDNYLHLGCFFCKVSYIKADHTDH